MNITPIERCSIGADAEYDVRVARSKGWSEFEIYPNGNLIGTSPAGAKYEPVPRYAEILREAAPDLLAALKIALPYVESFDDDNADLQTKAKAATVRAAIAKAMGSEAIERDEPQKPRTAFAARLAERIAELEAEREQAKGDARIIINGQIGLIRAIAHDYSEASNG